MQVQVLNPQGAATGETLTLSDAVFGIEPNDHAIYLDVRLIHANQRQGTHKTKERGEVSGTTKKAFRQKGTGGARRGPMRSPLMRHGGTIFGPRPRDYGFKLNKKVRRLARISALSYKAREEKIRVVDGLRFDTPSVKNALKTLEALKLDNRKTLLVTENYDTNLYRSVRNIPSVYVLHVNQLNTYDLVNAEYVLFQKGAVQILNQQAG